MRPSVAAKDSSSDALTAENQSLAEKLGDYETKAALLGEEIAALEAALAEKDAGSAEQAEEIARLQDELKTLQEKKEETNRTLEMLQAVAAETAFFSESDNGTLIHTYECPILTEGGEVLCMSMQLLEELMAEMGVEGMFEFCHECH